MTLFKVTTHSLMLLSAVLISFASIANPPKEIFWEDLIPEGHVQIDTQAQANHEGSEQNWV
ncbi:MAG TPA: DUF3299 domain-containing protein, partial [Pseudoalteromonas sp.]|nr:DUF3299 domain-containing protein [Pseudoalteromonas sp.]